MIFEVSAGHRTEISDKIPKRLLEMLRKSIIFTKCIIKDAGNVLEHERGFIVPGIGGGGS